MPCERRISDLQKLHIDNADELEKDAGDGWVEAFNIEDKSNNNNAIDIDSDEDKGFHTVNQPINKGENIDLDDLSDDDNMFGE